jgi:hypothetical protein
MKNLTTLLLLLWMPFMAISQQTLVASDARPDGIKDESTGAPKTAACGTPWLSSGYPAWTNYWGGYQFNIVNLSANDVMIHSFEARFQGTSGYRIYTKTGTFVGFETNAAAWTLVGQIAGGLTGLSTTAPTPIPIPVEICIPAGATQAFYLTRTDNNAANRHLYVPGTGTPGTTLYASNADIGLTEASNADIGLTEAHYVTPFFAALYAQSRRPSLDVCYSVGCTTLPVELIKLEAENDNGRNYVTWWTSTENNNDYFVVERSEDGVNFKEIGTMGGQGNSKEIVSYRFSDLYYTRGVVNYYRLKQVDYDGAFEYHDVISVDNTDEEASIIGTYNMMGQEVRDNYAGMTVTIYSDGRRVRRY